MYGYVIFGWPAYIPDDDRQLLPYFQKNDDPTIEQGIIMWGYKVVVPEMLRIYLPKHIHGSH